jgi:hypothetical protein
MAVYTPTARIRDGLSHSHLVGDRLALDLC